MLVPFRAYQPFRLSTIVPATATIEGLMSQPVMFCKVRLQNRSSSAVLEVSIDEVENLGLSADPLYTGQFTTRRLQIALSPGEVVWHDFGPPFLEPYNQTVSNIPTIYHILTAANQAVSPTINDVLAMSLYGVYELTTPAIRQPTVIG